MLIDSNELIGKALGSCTLQRLIGRGGMGAVYLARQARPRRTVAVKVLMPSMIMEQKSRAEFLTRFRREADAIAALDHVNIVPIYEYGEQEDIAYLVMPYIPGGTLRDVIEKRHTLPLEEVVPIIEQAAAALDSAHEQNIVHRDLKPGNMLFHADGRLLLADFGLAKVLRDTSDENGRKQTELTSVGTIIGTPEYLSPEQGTGKELDYRTDVYSLGVVLYQMLTGRVPFTGATPVAIALKHALEAPPPLHTLNPAISPVVEEVVLKALAKEPAERYASAGALARALRDAAKEVKARAKVQDVQTVISKQPAQQEISPAPELAEESAQTTPGGFAEHIPESAPEEEGTADEEATLKEDARQAIESYETQISTEGPHAEETEETPRIEPPPRPVVSIPDTDHIYQRNERGKKLPSPEPAVAVAPRRVEARRPEKRLQPVGMMLLGSFLTLIIIVGGLGIYTQFLTKKILPSPTIQANHHATPTARAAGSPGAVSLPPAKMPAAGTLVPGAGISIPPPGAMLYGTAIPGSTCDQQGGQWSSTQNAQISCAQGATIHNNDQTAPAGTFLEKLPQGKTMPANYVLQVDVTIHAGSSGNFGVFVREQPGQQEQSAYSILLAPPNTWRAYEYQNGSSTTLVQGINTQVPLTGTFTVDVLALNDTYVLFINGEQQGYAQSGTYLAGNIGLAVGAGADVTFQNLEIYPTA